MLFNSYEFLLFFPLVTVLFFLLPHRFRWVHLLLASCVFYMTFLPVYLLILFITIVVDYFAGIYISRSSGSRRRAYLVISLIANIGFLCLFKYFDFIVDNLNAFLHLNLPYLKELWLTSWIVKANNAVNLQLNTAFGTQFAILREIILPIGLSFHTFQAMSYTIEVYRGHQQPERDFGIYALYVMFYPQLVAGPIERPQNVLHQFHERKTFSTANLLSGLRLMAWGLLKKVVIADRVAQYVDIVYNAPEQFHWLNVAIAAVLFAIQIYCDFSGYSDMAIGMARVMGYELMTNFNFPLFSKSITEFWRRWHISLSTWFNDYLFTPIITSLRNWGKRAIVFGLIATFLISGLWHGAGWNFVLYGLLHGIAMVWEFLTKKKRKKIFGRLPLWLNQSISFTLTFFYVVLAFIFFRAPNVTEAFTVIRQVAAIKTPAAFKTILLNPDGITGFGYTSLLLTLIYGVYIFWIETRYSPRLAELNERPVRDVLFFTFTVVSIIAFGTFTKQSFIYFQF